MLLLFIYFEFPGIIWPNLAMPQALVYVSYILPQTFAADAARAILFRGKHTFYVHAGCIL